MAMHCRRHQWHGGHEKVVQMLLDAGAKGDKSSNESTDEGNDVCASK